MADIITRLLLKTNDFDANLNKAKGSVDNYQSGVSNMAKMAGSSFMKVAGSIGLVVSAGEGLTKLLNSSQELGDKTAASMMAAKGGVDEFFYSLGSGDFTSFLSGMDDIIAKSKDAYAELDQLGNTEISFDYFQGKFDESIAKARLNAKNKQLDNDDRDKAFKDWDNELKKKEEAGKTVASDALNALTKSLVVGTKISAKDISLDDFEKVMRIDIMPSDARNEEKDHWKEQYKEYVKLSNKIDSDRKVDVVRTNDYGKTKSINDAAKIAQEGAAAKYKDAIIYNRLLNKLSDDDLMKLTALGKKYYSTSQQIAQQRQELNESTTEFGTSVVAAKKTKEAEAKAASQKAAKEAADRKKNEIPIGSVTELDKLITEARKKYSNAVSDEGRTAALLLIQELEQKKIVLNITAKYNSQDLQEPKMSGLPTDGIDSKKIKLPKQKPAFNKKDVKLNQDYAESLAAIGDTMGSLSGLFDSNTASVLQWGLSLLTTIGNAIPKILEMSNANEIEAISAQRSAVANTTAASGEVLKAHAGIPFVGIALGLAGVAAIIAAMASMPKFATGGIVPGASFTGDRVPALLNSGEMILNGGQQSNLFKMLNRGVYGGISASMINPLSQYAPISHNIVQSESVREIKVSGTLRAKGCDLEASLTNYTHKKSKVR